MRKPRAGPDKAVERAEPAHSGDPMADGDAGARRKERREVWALRLQGMQALISIGGVVLIVIAYAQWGAAQRREEQDVYRTISKDWNEHLKFFVERPDLRPYFFAGRAVDPRSPDVERVYAVADVRLDLMDATLTHMEARGWTIEETYGWRATFTDGFRQSPAMCSVFFETYEHYSLLREIAREGCAGRHVIDTEASEYYRPGVANRQ
jgi:hypothetical protein